MEELNHRNFIQNSSDQNDILLLLYVLSCFLPKEHKTIVNIIIKVLEIRNLFQQRNDLSNYYDNEKPSLAEGIEKLKQEPYLQNSPEIMQMVSMMEMIMKFMQMKDLMEAMNEMNHSGNSDSHNASAPFDSFKNMDPALFEALLPPETAGMVHSFIDMMNSNNSDSNAEHNNHTADPLHSVLSESN